MVNAPQIGAAICDITILEAVLTKLQQTSADQANLHFVSLFF